MLPHLAGRPTTLKRFPDGVEGKFFYQKNAPSHRPDWLKTVSIPSDRGAKKVDYCVLDDLPSLIWAANLAAIELHSSLSQARRMDRPTAVVFDLDPGPPADLLSCCEVALMLRDLFEELQLETVVKTSGQKGMQVYVPLNTATSYARTKPFAEAVAQLLERQNPELVVSRMAKQLRGGKVFIDWSQNDEHKTTICAYSLRATEQPNVSAPLGWDEVEQAHADRAAESLVIDAPAMLARLPERGDLFAPMRSAKQRLPRL
jgi:bifunctional non-homologous end joining protein LigD